MTWKIFYTKQAQKDAKKISNSGLKKNVEYLLDVLGKNPFQNPPPYEKLCGDLSGALSRRINVQHRLIYEVLKAEKTIKVIRMWTHYE